MKSAKIKKVKKNKESIMEPDMETRVLRLENASGVGEALIYKVKKIDERMERLEVMFATILQLRNLVSQPKGYRSGEWHRRSGNVYQDVALPGSPNAQETETAAPAGKTPDDQRGNLPPPEQR